MRITRSTDDGVTWSVPEPFALTVQKTYYPGSLTTLKDGRLLHCWNRWSAEDNEKEPRSVLYSLSHDDGQTWSEPQPMPHDNKTSSVIRHPIVELTSGEWLAPLWDRTIVWDPVSGMAGPESLRPHAERVARLPWPYSLPPGGYWRTETLGEILDRDRPSLGLAIRFDEQGVAREVSRREYDKDGSRLDDAMSQATAGPLDPLIPRILAHRTLNRIRITDSISDTALAQLKSLPELRTLIVGGRRITDASMIELSHFPALQELTIYGTQTSDHGLAPTLPFPMLRRLRLSLDTGTGITPNGLSTFRSRIRPSRLRFSPIENAASTVGSITNDHAVKLSHWQHKASASVSPMRRSINWTVRPTHFDRTTCCTASTDRPTTQRTCINARKLASGSKRQRARSPYRGYRRDGLRCALLGWRNRRSPRGHTDGRASRKAKEAPSDVVIHA